MVPRLGSAPLHPPPFYFFFLLLGPEVPGHPIAGEELWEPPPPKAKPGGGENKIPPPTLQGRDSGHIPSGSRPSPLPPA